MTGAVGTARAVVAQAVTAARPGWDVRPYPFTPSQLTSGGCAVSVWRGDLTAHRGELGPVLLEHGLTVHLYAARTEGPEAEDELDGLLDELLMAVQAVEAVAFTRAERMTFDRKFQGWAITLSLTSPNIYRAAHTREDIR